MEWAQEIFGNVKRKVWFQTVQKKTCFLGGEEVLKKVLSSLKLTYIFLTIDGWKMTFPFERGMGYVRFREASCTCCLFIPSFWGFTFTRTRFLWNVAGTAPGLGFFFLVNGKNIHKGNWKSPVMSCKFSPHFFLGSVTCSPNMRAFQPLHRVLRVDKVWMLKQKSKSCVMW